MSFWIVLRWAPLPLCRSRQQQANMERVSVCHWFFYTSWVEAIMCRFCFNVQVRTWMPSKRLWISKLSCLLPLTEFWGTQQTYKGVFAVSVFRIPTHLHKSACFVNWGDRLVCMEPHKASYFWGGLYLRRRWAAPTEGGLVALILRPGGEGFLSLLSQLGQWSEMLKDCRVRMRPLNRAAWPDFTATFFCFYDTEHSQIQHS